MKTIIEEVLYNNSNNIISIRYKYDGGYYDMSGVTRVEFTLNATTVNSVDNPAYFDLTQSEGMGVLTLMMGSAGFLPADSGYATVRVFDATNPLGVVFSGPKGPTYVEVEVT